MQTGKVRTDEIDEKRIIKTLERLMKKSFTLVFLVTKSHVDTG